MADRAVLLRWCIAERETLRNELSQIDLGADPAQRVDDAKRIEKRLALLEIVLHHLKAQAVQ